VSLTDANAYAVLGIAESASVKEAKTAFRKLARRVHPDVSSLPDAEVRFKEARLAYEIVADHELRRRHDLALREARRPRCRRCGRHPVDRVGVRCAACKATGSARHHPRQHAGSHGFGSRATTTSVAVVYRMDPAPLGRPVRPYDPDAYWGEQSVLERHFGHLGYWTREGVPRWRKR